VNDLIDPISSTQRERALFETLEPHDGRVRARRLFRELSRAGLRRGDHRLRDLVEALDSSDGDETLDFEQFCAVTGPHMRLIERALRGQLVIPDFPGFTKLIEGMYQSALANDKGAVADYIPQLARVNPEQWAVAVCTIDGQRLSLGDARNDFPVESCTKPINYCIALEEHGEDQVHRHIGREPSGRGFNELTLNHEGRPHNPMINAGAIMACSLIERTKVLAERFEYVTSVWRRLAGGEKIGFGNAVYLSERATADRNFALAYMMREQKAFPEGTDLTETVEFYLQCCSIEANAEKMATVAATLANAGVCPTTGERVFSPQTVRDCLSLMSSCGMYDFSGEFAFTIGVPAKSGVSGVIFGVIPNVMGFCTYSPRLDRVGNSVRGLDFCRRLVDTFNFHQFDDLSGVSDKVDPRVGRVEQEAESVVMMIWAASVGDLLTIQQLLARGLSPDAADYDGRTPMHLAAAEGREAIVQFLITRGANLTPLDRWGHTPLDDARSGNHTAVVALLEAATAAAR
jgi:glutaminase